MFLDAGGVIVLPHRGLVHDALALVEIDVDPSAVARAHYHAARALDRHANGRGAPGGYLRNLCSALGVPEQRLPDAVRALSSLADRSQSGEILWSEATPHSQRMIGALRRAGMAVLVVTNSDGHAAENLRDAAICQANAGPGATITDVIDSVLVGSSKPDAGIFRTALRRARVQPTSVVHVGDMVSSDVDGALAAGITPIHLDPHRSCRARDHRHIRTLSSIWRHVARPSTRLDVSGSVGQRAARSPRGTAEDDQRTPDRGDQQLAEVSEIDLGHERHAQRGRPRLQSYHAPMV